MKGRKRARQRQGLLVEALFLGSPVDVPLQVGRGQVGERKVCAQRPNEMPQVHGDDEFPSAPQVSPHRFRFFFGVAVLFFKYASICSADKPASRSSGESFSKNARRSSAVMFCRVCRVRSRLKSVIVYGMGRPSTRYSANNWLTTVLVSADCVR